MIKKIILTIFFAILSFSLHAKDIISSDVNVWAETSSTPGYNETTYAGSAYSNSKGEQFFYTAFIETNTLGEPIFALLIHKAKDNKLIKACKPSDDFVLVDYVEKKWLINQKEYTMATYCEDDGDKTTLAVTTKNYRDNIEIISLFKKSLNSVSFNSNDSLLITDERLKNFKISARGFTKQTKKEQFRKIATKAKENHIGSIIQMAYLIESGFFSKKDPDLNKYMFKYQYHYFFKNNRVQLINNYESIKYWLDKGLKANHAGAQMIMAMLYKNGTIDLEKDMSEYYYWIDQSAAQNYRPANLEILEQANKVMFGE